jgi:formate dehydrogenase maturation protein FdhE
MRPNHVSRYIANPHFCPFCGADEIDASKTDAFENMMYQWVRCSECETEWHDVYELVGFEEVVAGKGL